MASAEMRFELCFNSIALAIVTVWTNNKHFVLLLTYLNVKNTDATVSVSTEIHYIYKYSNFATFTKVLLTLCGAWGSVVV